MTNEQQEVKTGRTLGALLAVIPGGALVVLSLVAIYRDGRVELIPLIMLLVGIFLVVLAVAAVKKLI